MQQLTEQYFDQDATIYIEQHPRRADATTRLPNRNKSLRKQRTQQIIYSITGRLIRIQEADTL